MAQIEYINPSFIVALSLAYTLFRGMSLVERYFEFQMKMATTKFEAYQQGNVIQKKLIEYGSRFAVSVLHAVSSGQDPLQAMLQQAGQLA